jgi:hypothetical protein
MVIGVKGDTREPDRSMVQREASWVNLFNINRVSEHVKKVVEVSVVF